MTDFQSPVLAGKDWLMLTVNVSRTPVMMCGEVEQLPAEMYCVESDVVARTTRLLANVGVSCFLLGLSDHSIVDAGRH